MNINHNDYYEYTIEEISEDGVTGFVYVIHVLNNYIPYDIPYAESDEWYDTYEQAEEAAKEQIEGKFMNGKWQQKQLSYAIIRLVVVVCITFVLMSLGGL